MELAFITTPNELMENCLWDDYCAIKGWSVWCVKEGLLRGDTQIRLTMAEARQLGVNWPRFDD